MQTLLNLLRLESNDSADPKQIWHIDSIFWLDLGHVKTEDGRWCQVPSGVVQGNNILLRPFLAMDRIYEFMLITLNCILGKNQQEITSLFFQRKPRK